MLQRLDMLTGGCKNLTFYLSVRTRSEIEQYITLISSKHSSCGLHHIILPKILRGHGPSGHGDGLLCGVSRARAQRPLKTCPVEGTKVLMALWKFGEMGTSSGVVVIT
ncbi:hypothetical protein TNCV_4627871 [Trichonephila clavipes]|nr:hypothetical protein TNCV_4627871 [Trichonephila clavipes]